MVCVYLIVFDSADDIFDYFVFIIGQHRKSMTSGTQCFLKAPVSGWFEEFERFGLLVYIQERTKIVLFGHD